MKSKERMSLKELQSLDTQLGAVRSTIDNFEVKLEELEAPTLKLEEQIKGLAKRLQELSLEEKRLKLTIQEKHDRSEKLQDRMSRVRNIREETAVHAETEMVKKALQNDELEARENHNRLSKMTDRLNEQKETQTESLAQMEPLRKELMSEREDAELNLEKLLKDREVLAGTLDTDERKTYERITSGHARVAVSELTEDGACGHCYSIVPLQMQSEIRYSETLIRCEECGVILTPHSAEVESGTGTETDVEEEGPLMSEMESPESENLEAIDT